MQSRIGSLVEAGVNVLIGYLVAMLAQAVIFPMFGFTAGVVEHAQIAGLFTLVSLARSYILRRVFNLFERRKRQ